MKDNLQIKTMCRTQNLALSVSLLGNKLPSGCTQSTPLTHSMDVGGASLASVEAACPSPKLVFQWATPSNSQFSRCKPHLSIAVLSLIKIIFHFYLSCIFLLYWRRTQVAKKRNIHIFFYSLKLQYLGILRRLHPQMLNINFIFMGAYLRPNSKKLLIHTKIRFAFMSIYVVFWQLVTNHSQYKQKQNNDVG